MKNTLSLTHTLHPAYRKSGCLLIIPISLQRSDAVLTGSGQLVLFDFHHRQILLQPDPSAASPTRAGDPPAAQPAATIHADPHPGSRVLARLQPVEPERHYHDMVAYHGTIIGPDFTLSIHPGHPFRRHSIRVRSTHPAAIHEPETDLLRTAISGDHWGLFGQISFQRGTGPHPSLIIRHSPGFEDLALITGSLLLISEILPTAD